jgi:hypothetical protein
VRPDLLKLAVEVGALPSPAMPEPKPLVPFSMGAPDASWGERLKRREALAEYKQYSRGGKSFLLDKDIPMLESLGEGEAGLEAMRKAIREGADKDWTHPQVAIPRDVDLLKRFPGFQKSMLPSVRLPGEPRGGATWRRGRLHAHEYGPVWLMHEDAHAPQSKRVTDLKGAMKLREMLTIEAARHMPEAGRAQVRRYRALRPVVVDSPKGRWEREKEASASEAHLMAAIRSGEAQALLGRAPSWFSRVAGGPARRHAAGLQGEVGWARTGVEAARQEAKRLSLKELEAESSPYLASLARQRMQNYDSRAAQVAEELQQFAKTLEPAQVERSISSARIQAALGGTGLAAATTAPAVAIPLGVAAHKKKEAQAAMPQPQVDPTGNMWGLAGGAGTLLAGGLAGRAVLPQIAGSRVSQHLLTDAQLATAKKWATRKGALGGAILAAIPAWQVAKMVANSPRRHTAWQHQVFGF